ncbi:relE [Escherichia coli]|nr:relE [Escherichia coli]
MTYTVKFRDDALKEWLRLDKAIQQQFTYRKLKNQSIPLSTPYAT